MQTAVLDVGNQDINVFAIIYQDNPEDNVVNDYAESLNFEENSNPTEAYIQYQDNNREKVIWSQEAILNFLYKRMVYIMCQRGDALL